MTGLALLLPLSVDVAAAPLAAAAAEGTEGVDAEVISIEVGGAKGMTVDLARLGRLLLGSAERWTRRRGKRDRVGGSRSTAGLSSVAARFVAWLFPQALRVRWELDGD